MPCKYFRNNKMIVILKLIMTYNTNKPASSYSRVAKVPL